MMKGRTQTETTLQSTVHQERHSVHRVLHSVLTEVSDVRHSDRIAITLMQRRACLIVLRMHQYVMPSSSILIEHD